MDTVKGNSTKVVYSNRFNENVELRQYYYGEKMPDCTNGSGPVKRKRFHRSRVDSEMDVHIKCTACPKVFKKNSEIIPHIYEHIEQDDEGNFIIRERRHPLRPSSLRCSICMKKTTMDSITGHMKNSHEMKNHTFTCRICELYYDNKRALVNHMHYTHPCMDMPYSCDICGYKTSFRTLLFKHFEELHLKNYVLCNFCLMILSVESSQEMKSVEAHLMQHARINQPKCPHCALRFVSLQQLREHLTDNHQRLPDTTQIEQMKLYKLGKGEDPIFMWAPLNKNPRRTREAPTKTLPSTLTTQNSVQIPAGTANHKKTDSDDDLEIVYENVVSTRHFNNEDHFGDCHPGSSFGRQKHRIIPAEFLEALGLRRSCDISVISNPTTNTAGAGTGGNNLNRTKSLL